RARARPARARRQARGRSRVSDRALRQPAPRRGGGRSDARKGARRARRPGRRTPAGSGARGRDHRGRSDRRGRAGCGDRPDRGGGPGPVSAPERVRHRVVDFLGFTPLAHRPPLPKRWWVYCAVAFLAPSLVLATVPAHQVPYRDLVWLLTLVPAYL